MATINRRSIWDSEEYPYSGDLGRSFSLQPQMPSAPTIVEQLRVVRKRKRDRSWERAHRPMLIRGVPPKARELMKEIAEDLNIRVDDVARAFLEFGLQCHQKGELKLNPVLRDQRLTLFPGPEDGWRQPGWVEKLWDYKPPARKNKLKRQTTGSPKPWRWQVAYRGIPNEIQEKIRKLYRENHIPLGEVVTMLLGHSLEAYQEGRLVLNPQPDQD